MVMEPKDADHVEGAQPPAVEPEKSDHVEDAQPMALEPTEKKREGADHRNPLRSLLRLRMPQRAEQRSLRSLMCQSRKRKQRPRQWPPRQWPRRRRPGTNFGFPLSPVIQINKLKTDIPLSFYHLSFSRLAFTVGLPHHLPVTSSFARRLPARAHPGHMRKCHQRRKI